MNTNTLLHLIIFFLFYTVFIWSFHLYNCKIIEKTSKICSASYCMDSCPFTRINQKMAFYRCQVQLGQSFGKNHIKNSIARQNTLKKLCTQKLEKRTVWKQVLFINWIFLKHWWRMNAAAFFEPFFVVQRKPALCRIHGQISKECFIEWL